MFNRSNCSLFKYIERPPHIPFYRMCGVIVKDKLSDYTRYFWEEPPSVYLFYQILLQLDVHLYYIYGCRCCWKLQQLHLLPLLPFFLSAIFTPSPIYPHRRVSVSLERDVYVTWGFFLVYTIIIAHFNEICKSSN